MGCVRAASAYDLVIGLPIELPGSELLLKSISIRTTDIDLRDLLKFKTCRVCEISSRELVRITKLSSR